MPKHKFTREEALSFHMNPRPGKFDIVASVPMTTQRDLSLAYSPGGGCALRGDRRRPGNRF